MKEKDAILERLDGQIIWYDNKSIENQKWYKKLKIIEISIAASIPFVAGFLASLFFLGLLGVLIVILEGVQSVYQFHHNWTTYRSTCEELKHEKYLWQAKAGPYASAETPDILLAERVESLISREHSKWVSGREKSAIDIKKHK